MFAKLLQIKYLSRLGHLLYPVLLGFGIWRAVRQQVHFQQYTYAQCAVQEMANQHLGGLLRNQLMAIAKQHDAYFHPVNRQLYVVAFKADSLTNNLLQVCEALRKHQTLRGNPVVADLKWEYKKLQAFCQNGGLPTDQSRYFQDGFLIEDFEHQLSSRASKAEAEAMLVKFELDARTRLGLLLTRIGESMLSYEKPVEAFCPVISIKEPPRAGKPFRAEVFAYAVAPNDSNYKQRFWINGLEYPHEQGVVHFETVFKTPGRKRLNLVMTYGFQDQIRTYTKEFEVKVLKNK